MDIVLNERSFDGGVAPYEVMPLMQQLADVIDELRLIGGDTCQVLLHSEFFGRHLTPELTVATWVFDQQYREGNDISDSWQALIGAFRQALTQGPHIDELLAEQFDPAQYACECQGIEAEGSGIDAAAQLRCMLVSRHACPSYPDGALSIVYYLDGGEPLSRPVAHFTEIATARRCRRRYVPNPKHHPARAHGDHSPMPMDTVYDPLERHERELRNRDLRPWDTLVQRLLDHALPHGKQLYARVYDANRRTYIFYEFQPDNPELEICCFHGYPVPQSEVPSLILRQFEETHR